MEIIMYVRTAWQDERLRALMEKYPGQNKLMVEPAAQVLNFRLCTLARINVPAGIFETVVGENAVPVYPGYWSEISPKVVSVWSVSKMGDSDSGVVVKPGADPIFGLFGVGVEIGVNLFLTTGVGVRVK